MTEDVRNSSEAKLRQGFCWLLVILWMACIFSFSAKTALESNAQSGQVIRTGAELMVPDFKELPPPEQNDFISQWQHTVRKSAHGIAFFVLGILCWLAAAQHSWGRKKQTAAALTIPAAYAVFDEIHQLFVSGRAFMVADIGIDTLAAAVGVLLITLLVQARKRA
ncbi:MAG: VanZ family protein [Syntrophomonadaceae bacterium]